MIDSTSLILLFAMLAVAVVATLVLHEGAKPGPGHVRRVAIRAALIGAALATLGCWFMVWDGLGLLYLVVWPVVFAPGFLLCLPVAVAMALALQRFGRAKNRVDASNAQN